MAHPLERENAALRAALATSRAETASARGELAEVRSQLDEVLQLVAVQNGHISDLRTMLRRKLERRKTGGSDAPADSEADTAPGPVAAPAPDVPAAEAPDPPAEAPDPPPDPRPKKPPGSRNPRGKGTGRTPPPDHLPKRTLNIPVCACDHCGSTNLLARDVEQSVRLDAVETIARLQQEFRNVSLCKDCGRTTTAKPPSLPCPRSKFTCGFLAWLVVMKFVYLVPLNRIRRQLKRQGIVLAKGTLVRLIELATTLADAVDGAHWAELRAGHCILTDATGLKVRIEGLPVTWDAVIDVFNRDATTVYQFALTKHGDAIAALLRGIEGVVMCDAESRLNELCRQEGVKRANCNAHPRRAFRDAEAAQPVLAKEAGAFLTRMYAVERQAAKEGLTGAALLARRQEKTRPIVNAFKIWLETHRGLLPTDPLGKVIAYYLRHFDDLTRFVDDAEIPIDNNRSERAFQDHARLRLNSLFAGSAEGGHRWAVLLGVVTTAQRLDLDVQAYLTWMFERRGTRKREFGLRASQLTPAAYKQMLEETRRQAAA